MIKEMTTNETIFSCMGVPGHHARAKQLLVMDEVDGMSGELPCVWGGEGGGEGEGGREEAFGLVPPSPIGSIFIPRIHTSLPRPPPPFRWSGWRAGPD